MLESVGIFSSDGNSIYPSVFHVKKEGVTKFNIVALLLLPLSLLSLLLFVFRPQAQRA